MKKFISTVIVGLFLFSAAPTSLALDNPFPDLPSDHPNYDAILSLYEWGTISGYPDGTFKPDNEINRAEFLKILVRSGLQLMCVRVNLLDGWMVILMVVTSPLRL